MTRYIVFQKVVEVGSFTKVAEILGYTQSAISHMISSLEEEMSLKLLTRSRVGVKLTLEGENIYPYIENLILQYKTMREHAAEIKGLESGVVRIGTMSGITCHWLPPLFKNFQKQYPKVEFVLHQGDYSIIHEWIKNEAVDFGFISPHAANGLKTITLKEGRLCAILPKEHPLAALNVIPLEKLTNEPFILLEEGSFYEPLEAFHKCNLEPNVKYTVHDAYSIMNMVEAGLGVSILAELLLRRTNYNIAIRPTEPAITRTLAIGYKDRCSLPVASKYFIDYIIANMDLLPD